MPGFFEALRNLQDVPVKKHTVLVDGKTIEIDLETKKKVIQHGAHAFTCKDGKVILKPKPTRPKVVYKQLKKGKFGYEFHGSDPHWPFFSCL